MMSHSNIARVHLLLPLLAVGVLLVLSMGSLDAQGEAEAQREPSLRRVQSFALGANPMDHATSEERDDDDQDDATKSQPEAQAQTEPPVGVEPAGLPRSKSTSRMARFMGGAPSRFLEAKYWRALDFRAFKSKFGRRYRSEAEESRRQKLYTARLMEAAKSVWRYMTHKSETYHSINSRSDTTPEERDLGRARRPRLLVNPALLVVGEVPLVEDPLRRRVQMTNGTGGRLFTAPISSLPSGSGAWWGRLAGGGGGGGSSSAASPKADLRTTKCFLEPSDQGRCESCASFVAMAQLEYLHCRETGGQLVKFSEQFPVDCGSPFGMMGCRGTDVVSLNKFLETAGVESAAQYAYTGAKLRCPYYNKASHSYAWDLAGEFKLRNTKLVAAPRSSWSKYLGMTIPLHVGVLTSHLFEDYGGGIASSCDRDSGAHGMLLVGEGRDNGHAYWLLRNSFGAAWGEAGYFRLNKRATQCFTDEGRGYFPEAFALATGDSFVRNRQHSRRA